MIRDVFDRIAEQRSHLSKPCEKVKRSESGFTLTEMLLSIIIIVLVTTIAASGISTAFSSYRKAVDGSNAQIALSTTTAKLRDELTYAKAVKLKNGTNEVAAYLTADGYWASIGADGSGRGLVKHVYRGDVDELVEVGDSPYPLLADAAITDNLTVTFSDASTSGIHYEDGVFSVYGLEVLYGQDEIPVADVGASNGDCYKIRAVGIASETV